MQEQWRDRIVRDSHVLHGKPCFRETRIPVALVLGYLAWGKTTSEVIEQFPDLKLADIAAALEYARDLADFETVTF
ncbi:MAG TPA: DUF433 domain-containing protein [Tepidisphaeraceae bacterium]|nr:DUF433 domain-containing protein [Tepidisphaeraceae bacterium]